MKRTLCVLLTAVLALLAGHALAQGYTGYASLDADPMEAITFDGVTVTWAGQTFTLDENTYFLDCRLDESQISENPYAFQDIRTALAALNDGTADKPMTLLIAPGVYWLRNFGTNGGTDSLHCTARAIHVDCEFLNVYGLSHEAKNVVVGLERYAQVSERYGDPYFDMFIVEGSGLRCENVTIGSYETHTLEYALDPGMSRERIIADPELQQMLFCTGGDGVAINCCFEGRMSLNQFAEYYKDCRMLVGCRVKNGVCVNCTIELNDNSFGAADLFGCEVIYDPIVLGMTRFNKIVEFPTEERYEFLSFIAKYVEDMYLLPGEENDPYFNLNFAHGSCPVVDREGIVYLGKVNWQDSIIPRASAFFAGETTTLTEEGYLVWKGNCKEMGLEMTVVQEPWVDENIQAAHDQKVAALRAQLEAARNQAIRKQIQKKLDIAMNEVLPQVYDVMIPVEVAAGTLLKSLEWHEIEAIRAWELQNPGRRVILPQSKNHYEWYRVSEGEYVYDDQGNLQDDYVRDENGELVYYYEGERNAAIRLNGYNYFLFQYGINPEAVYEYQSVMYSNECAINFAVDTNVSRGNQLKNLDIDLIITHYGLGGLLPCVVNLSADGQAYEIEDMLLSYAPYIIPDDRLNAIRVQTPDGVIYNLPNIYGEDPFNEAELIRQAAIVNGEEADAYLNIPLELPEH